MKDSFTIELPWGSAALADFNADERPLLLLQQHIIEHYQDELESALDEIGRLKSDLVWHNALRKRIDDMNVEHEALKDELSVTRVELTSYKNMHREAEKKCERLQAELAGVPKLVENKVAAELARLKAVSGDELNAAKEMADEFRSKNIRLSENMSAMNSENVTLKAENASLHKMVESLKEKAETLTKFSHGARDEIVELARQNKLLIEKSAYLAEELDREKTNSVYLNTLLDYDDMREVYRGDDGTFVYVASTKGSISVDDDEDCALHPDYPIFMGVRPDGVAHLMFIDNKKELCYPKIMGDLCVDKRHYDAILEEALKATTKAHCEKVDKSIAAAKNIARTAHLLDFDWSAKFDLKQFCDSLAKADDRKTVQQLADVSDAMTAVRGIAKEYQKMLKRKELASKKPKKKGRK